MLSSKRSARLHDLVTSHEPHSPLLDALRSITHHTHDDSAEQDNCDGVNVIINSVFDSGIGYRNKEFYVLILLYADDGMARLWAEDMIGVVVGRSSREIWVKYK